MEEQAEFVTWAGVNNWVPIIISLLMVSTTFGALMTRVAILEEQNKTIIAQQATIINHLDSNEDKYEVLSLQVNRNETILERLIRE